MEFHYYILLLLLIVASYFDFRFSIIPNWLTLGGMAAGLLYYLIREGYEGLFYSMIALLIGGGIFLILYLFKAIGAGDVKLFAAIGAIVGTKFVLYSMMYSIVFAGLIGLLILLFTRTFMKRMLTAFFALLGSVLSRDITILDRMKTEQSLRFPFMYAVIPGVCTTFYYLMV